MDFDIVHKDGDRIKRVFGFCCRSMPYSSQETTCVEESEGASRLIAETIVDS